MKPSSPASDLDAAAAAAEVNATLLSAFGSMFEVGEPVNCTTHSGTVFKGIVEDSNLAGILVRTAEERVFFVSYSGIESAEIFERDDAGDGETVEGEGEEQPTDAPESEAPRSAE